MTDEALDIVYRIMDEKDIDRYPVGCQGEMAEIKARIADLGASAMLAFDDDQHIGQLQFRRYDANLRSPNGLFDPLYWGDFGDHAPDMPDDTLSLFCYHVGQTDDSDARNPRYQGRGVGAGLLDRTLSWAEARGFEAVIAKAAPSVRAVMSFMGGQSVEVYLERGFEVHDRWVDSDLSAVIAERSLIASDIDPNDAARVSCCIKRFVSADSDAD